MDDRSCPWCGRAFIPRTSGGYMQRFCRPTCRRALDATGRRWIAAALGSGTLTVASLKDAAGATRALLPATATEERAPIPPQISDNAAELLDDLLIALLELPDDAWSDIAVALPDELFDRIDSYIQAALL